jgi:hypothetical protein
VAEVARPDVAGVPPGAAVPRHAAAAPRARPAPPHAVPRALDGQVPRRDAGVRARPAAARPDGLPAHRPAGCRVHVPAPFPDAPRPDAAQAEPQRAFLHEVVPYQARRHAARSPQADARLVPATAPAHPDAALPLQADARQEPREVARLDAPHPSRERPAAEPLVPQAAAALPPAGPEAPRQAPPVHSVAAHPVPPRAQPRAVHAGLARGAAAARHSTDRLAARAPPDLAPRDARPERRPLANSTDVPPLASRPRFSPSAAPVARPPPGAPPPAPAPTSDARTAAPDASPA